jgi:hypothetical protein
MQLALGSWALSSITQAAAATTPAGQSQPAASLAPRHGTVARPAGQARRLHLRRSREEWRTGPPALSARPVRGRTRFPRPASAPRIKLALPRPRPACNRELKRTLPACLHVHRAPVVSRGRMPVLSPACLPGGAATCRRLVSFFVSLTVRVRRLCPGRPARRQFKTRARVAARYTA